VDRASKAALGSVAVGALVLALKYAAYLLTGSVALYSDALESIINIATAAAALLALRVSAKPADANHPYGHHKAEYFSAVLEGVLIVLAALAILREAYLGFLNPRPLDAPAIGLAVNALASTLNGAWAWFLIRNGRRWRSPALVADGKHLFTDVVTSGGVLVGVGLVAVTGWLVLDPALAALVAVNILWSGWGLVRSSVGGLMDEAVPPEVLARIKGAIAEHGEGALERMTCAPGTPAGRPSSTSTWSCRGRCGSRRRTRSATGLRPYCERTSRERWSLSTSSQSRRRSTAGCSFSDLLTPSAAPASRGGVPRKCYRPISSF
jgi:cation diffusion facilitator family transporter